MLLALASLLCLVSVPLAGGRLGALAHLRLRATGFLLAGLALQVLAIEIVPDAPAPLPAAAHVASYALIAVAFWGNRDVPFLWVIGLGGLLNGIAIAANDGVMPARAGALATAGLDDHGTAFQNSAAVAHPHLAFLGDVFAVPAGWPAANVFSIGDVLIVVGLALLLHAWCGRGQAAAGTRASSASAASASAVTGLDHR